MDQPTQEPPQTPPQKGLSTGCVVALVLGIIAVVIVGGIAIVAAMMFPVTKRVQEKANTVKAEATSYNLKNAISAYFVEYRKYPVADSESSGDTEMSTEKKLMNVLLAADSESVAGGLNPRGITFYSGHQAKPAGDGSFRNGLVLDSDGGGELWDPFGNHYRVILDTDNNGSVESPELSGATIPEVILIWSAGPDGDFDTWSDNIKTW